MNTNVVNLTNWSENYGITGELNPINYWEVLD